MPPACPWFVYFWRTKPGGDAVQGEGVPMGRLDVSGAHWVEVSLRDGLDGE